MTQSLCSYSTVCDSCSSSTVCVTCSSSAVCVTCSSSTVCVTCSSSTVCVTCSSSTVYACNVLCCDVLSHCLCRVQTGDSQPETAGRIGEGTRMGGSAQVHTHTHAHIPAHTHVSYIIFATVPGEICTHDLVLLPCQPHSRDAAIKALELDLAAAPKQERMDQLVCAHWSMR